MTPYSCLYYHPFSTLVITAGGSSVNNNSCPPLFHAIVTSMKKWSLVIMLAVAQFVMVLDSTVMNVSISTVVKDLDTTVASMQTAITFYTLTMASFMLLGGKLGDVFGRKKAFLIGSAIYSVGSLMTALSPNIQTLFIGWSVIEGLGAVLVIPAIAALIAINYKGKDRAIGFAVIGGISGAAAAAGPLIGGYVTTYLDWRYVFAAETVIMIILILLSKSVNADKPQKAVKIDVWSAVLSASGLCIFVYGVLQSKVWGLITPRAIPSVNEHEIAPFGISIVAYLIILGLVVLYLFYSRQEKLEREGRNPLLKTSMFSIRQLRSGLGTLGAQYMIIASVFFVIPIYLQMTLGYDALKTGLKILPLSIAIVLFSVVGAKFTAKYGPRKIVQVGQLGLVVGALCLQSSVSVDLKNGWFFIGMFVIGSGLGLLASQLGNVNMSAVDKSQSSEVGGLQGVFQNLGSSLGTAIIGSVMIASLTTAFVGNITSSNLNSEIKNYVNTNSQAGVSIVPVSEVQSFAESKGLSNEEASEATSIYASSQVDALKVSLFAVVILALLGMLLSRGIPSKVESVKS